MPGLRPTQRIRHTSTSAMSLLQCRTPLRSTDWVRQTSVLLSLHFNLPSHHELHAGLVKDANASLLSQIIADAGSDFGLPEPDSSYDVLSVNQPIYAKAFADFIHQLQPNNQSALQQAFSDDVAAAIITRLTRQNARPDNTGPFIELAHATGEDSSFVNALQQVTALRTSFGLSLLAHMLW